MSGAPASTATHPPVMTQEEYQAARRAHSVACRPLHLELVAMAAAVTRFVDGMPVYSQADEVRRRMLMRHLDELQRHHFPLSFCRGCGRVFVNCSCPDD